MALDQPPVYKRFALGVVALAVSLIVIVMAVSAMRGADAGPGAPDRADPLPVRTQMVRFEPAAQIETRFPALIAARRESALGFETGGRIAEISYDVGDRVDAGARLASLDTRSLEAQRASARSRASAARARAALAEVTLTRQRQLVEQGHVAPQRLDESRANFRAAEAEAEAAGAEAQSLDVRIELSRIEAPFAGVITARMIDEGGIASPGAPVLQLVEAEVLELRARLPEASARALEPGALYEVELDGRRIEVRFRATTGVIEIRQRAVIAVFDVDPGSGASSGAVGRLVLPGTLEDRGFWAPVTALAEGRRGLWSVYALVPDEGAFTLEPRPVEILHTEGEAVYLAGAVADGAEILTSGPSRVAPGQSVRPAGED